MSINAATPRDWDRLGRGRPDVREDSDDFIDCQRGVAEAIQESMSAEAFKGYCKGAVLKYLWGYERKAKPLEDLKEAQRYLNKLIEIVENE